MREASVTRFFVVVVQSFSALFAAFDALSLSFPPPSLRDRNCLLMRASATLGVEEGESSLFRRGFRPCIMPAPSLVPPSRLLPEFCFGAAKSMPRTASIKSGRTHWAGGRATGAGGRPVKSSSSPSLPHSLRDPGLSPGPTTRPPASLPVAVVRRSSHLNTSQTLSQVHPEKDGSPRSQ